MMTAFASTDTAVEAMRLGALDYFTKPFSMDELRLKIRQQLEAQPIEAGESTAQARAQQKP